jgi:hypothetical protein
MHEPLPRVISIPMQILWPRHSPLLPTLYCIFAFLAVILPVILVVIT